MSFTMTIKPSSSPISHPPIMSRPPLIPSYSSPSPTPLPHSMPLLPSMPDSSNNNNNNNNVYPSESLPHFAQRNSFSHSLAPLPSLPDKHHHLARRVHQQHHLLSHPQQLVPQQHPPPPSQHQHAHHLMSQQKQHPTDHLQQWPNRIFPTSRVFPQPDFPLALLNKISELEEKVRFSHFLPEIMSESNRQAQTSVLTLDPDGRLHVPGRKRDDNILSAFGFPKTDQDVDYCLEDTPGLSPANFNMLKNSLLNNLSRVRQAALDCVADLDQAFTQQLHFRTITTEEYERRILAAVSRFCKSRKQILHKYRGYVRNRRWIENVATRQRRGCLTHRQNNILRLWLFSNFSNPYPDAADKRTLIQQTQLSMTQINNWLINARSRVWKPTVEVMSGERIRREVLDSEDVGGGKDDSRLELKHEIDFLSSPDQAQPHHSVGHPNQVTAMSSTVPVASAHAATSAAGGAQVETLTDEGTWLGPQTWGSLDFGSDVPLTNQLHG